MLLDLFDLVVSEDGATSSRPRFVPVPIAKYSSGHQSFFSTVVPVIAIAGTGTLVAQNASLAGAGVSGSTGTGSLAAQSSTLAGIGVSKSTGAGVLLSGAASLAGSGVSRSTGTGSLVAGSSAIVSAGVSSSTGTGVLVSQSASLSSVGVVANAGEIVGSGVLVSGDASMSGVGVVRSIASQRTGGGRPQKVRITTNGQGSLRSTPSTMDGDGEVTWDEYNELLLLLLAA